MGRILWLLVLVFSMEGCHGPRVDDPIAADGGIQVVKDSSVNVGATGDVPKMDTKTLVTDSAIRTSDSAWSLSDLAIEKRGIVEFPIPFTNYMYYLPRLITEGPDGNMWFTSNNRNSITRMDKTGSMTEYRLPTGGTLGAGCNPGGIIAGPDGNVWFTETMGNKIGRITPTGEITEFALPTKQSNPEGITVGSDGNLWFTELGKNAIGSMRLTGELLAEYVVPLIAKADAVSGQPSGIALGPDGNFWFTEIAAGDIGRISPTGEITQFKLPKSRAQPQSIVLGDDGNLWFTEYGAGTIGRISPSGQITEFPVDKRETVWYLAKGPDGNIWFTAAFFTVGNSGYLGRITPDGVITKFPIETARGAPLGIAVGTDGKIWFTEPNAEKIGYLVL